MGLPGTSPGVPPGIPPGVSPGIAPTPVPRLSPAPPPPNFPQTNVPQTPNECSPKRRHAEDNIESSALIANTCLVALKGLDILVARRANSVITPALKVSAEGFYIDGWSANFKTLGFDVKSHFVLDAMYFNDLVASWEPIVEPWDLTLSLNLIRDIETPSSLPGADPIKCLGNMSLSISSETRLNLMLSDALFRLVRDLKHQAAAPPPNKAVTSLAMNGTNGASGTSGARGARGANAAGGVMGSIQEEEKESNDGSGSSSRTVGRGTAASSISTGRGDDPAGATKERISIVNFTGFTLLVSSASKPTSAFASASASASAEGDTVDGSASAEGDTVDGSAPMSSFVVDAQWGATQVISVHELVPAVQLRARSESDLSFANARADAGRGIDALTREAEEEEEEKKEGGGCEGGESKRQAPRRKRNNNGGLQRQKSAHRAQSAIKASMVAARFVKVNGLYYIYI